MMNKPKYISGSVIFIAATAGGIAMTDVQVPVDPAHLNGQQRLATFLEKISLEGRKPSNSDGMFFDFSKAEEKDAAVQAEIAARIKKEEEEHRARVQKAIEAEKAAPIQAIGEERAEIAAKYDRYGNPKIPGVEYDKYGLPVKKKD